jgi:MOSC domain-containing protein YiiM
MAPWRDGQPRTTRRLARGGLDGPRPRQGRARADDHQAFPGAYGENLTLIGIDWASLAPGDRLSIGEGDAALALELTKPASPCQTIAHWFTERRIARISAKVVPSDTRWYARVLREGEVRAGMPVRLERALPLGD